MESHSSLLRTGVRRGVLRRMVSRCAARNGCLSRCSACTDGCSRHACAIGLALQAPRLGGHRHAALDSSRVSPELAILVVACRRSEPQPAPSTSPSAKARRWRSRCRPIARRSSIDLQGGLWTLPIKGARPSGSSTSTTMRGSPRGRPTARASRFRRTATARGASGRWRRTAATRRRSPPAPSTIASRTGHPTARRIAFSSDRSGNYDVWVLDVKSRQVTQVTKHPANDFTPTWSPDGTEIAFVSKRTPSPGVYAVTPGGAERLLVEAAGRPSARRRGRPTAKTSSTAWRAAAQRASCSAGRSSPPNEDVFPFRAQWMSADRISLHGRRQDQAPHVARSRPAAPSHQRSHSPRRSRDARELHAQEARLQRDGPRSPCSASCIRARRATASASRLRRWAICG